MNAKIKVKEIEIATVDRVVELVGSQLQAATVIDLAVISLLIDSGTCTVDDASRRIAQIHEAFVRLLEQHPPAARRRAKTHAGTYIRIDHFQKLLADLPAVLRAPKASAPTPRDERAPIDD